MYISGYPEIMDLLMISVENNILLINSDTWLCVCELEQNLESQLKYLVYYNMHILFIITCITAYSLHSPCIGYR